MSNHPYFETDLAIARAIVRVYRLTRLLEILRVLKKHQDQFCMTTWIEKSPKCKTVGCIGGWASMDHAFQIEGLNYRINAEDNVKITVNKGELSRNDALYDYDVTKPSSNLDNLTSLAAFFMLDTREAESLFLYGTDYPSRKSQIEDSISFVKHLIKLAQVEVTRNENWQKQSRKNKNLSLVLSVMKRRKFFKSFCKKNPFRTN